MKKLLGRCARVNLQCVHVNVWFVIKGQQVPNNGGLTRKVMVEHIVKYCPSMVQ